MLQGAAEAGDFGDRAGWQARQDGLGEASSGGVAVLVEAGADLLGAAVGDLDLDVFFAGGERRVQPCLLPFGEVLLAGAEDVPDPVERVVAAAAVPGGVLLNPAADVIDDGAGELDDVERVEHGDGVLELVVDGVLVAVERVEGRDLHARPEVLASLDEPVPVGGPGPAGHQVEEAGVDVSVLVTGEVDHPGELLRAAAAVLDRLGGDVVPDVLVDAEHLDTCEAGRVGVRGSQDSQTVRQPVPSWRRRPLTEACSRRSWSIAHRQARVVSLARGAATRSSCSMNVVTGQVGSGQIQRRLRQQIRTGRPIAGASTRRTSSRP